MSPGRLVPTTALTRSVQSGIPVTRPVPGIAFIPNDLPPTQPSPAELLAALHADIIETERAITAFIEAALHLPNPRILITPLAQREAQASSTIENTIATAQEISVAQAGDPEASAAAIETNNYLRALDLGLRSPLPLCVRLMHEMHAVLLSDVRGGDKRPGTFRDVQVYIGGTGGFSNARFVPPPPGETLHRCMASLEHAFHTLEQHGLPRLVAIAYCHYQFECVHPYRDGNGRLGRLLMALDLCRHWKADRALIPFSVYIERNRQEYYDRLLRVSTHADWMPWVRFIITAIRTQADDARLRIAHLNRLRARMLTVTNAGRSTSAAPRLVDMFFAQPIMTAAQAARELGVRPSSAQRSLDRLVKAGMLSHPDPRRYGRLYAAHDILALVEAEHVESIDPT